MNVEKLRILVDYLSTLSKLDGSYHKEVSAAIYSIENELGIVRGDKGKVSIVSEDNETIKINKNGIVITGIKIDVNRTNEENEKFLDYMKKNLNKLNTKNY